jgi:hypothetical protein
MLPATPYTTLVFTPKYDKKSKKGRPFKWAPMLSDTNEETKNK